MIMGTVTEIAASGKPVVYVDGDSAENAREMLRAKGLNAAVGDRVFVERSGGQYVVVAAVEV